MASGIMRAGELVDLFKSLTVAAFLGISTLLSAGLSLGLGLQSEAPPDDLDARVRSFLGRQRWHDLNVPTVDGRTMYDIIVNHGYTRALEIGTSTGHSGVWIGWALSKTGGRLITIDIDERRQQLARENFAAAGLDRIIDLRCGDAHFLVPALEGPFDFVFSDADKGWYREYLEAVLPKLAEGGCFVTHNVSPNGLFGGGSREYVDYLLSISELETTFDTRGGGMAISYKRRK